MDTLDTGYRSRFWLHARSAGSGLLSIESLIIEHGKRVWPVKAPQLFERHFPVLEPAHVDVVNRAVQRLGTAVERLLRCGCFNGGARRNCFARIEIKPVEVLANRVECHRIFHLLSAQ